MRGIVRPCRHQLGPELRERWRRHLCGLCLTLRDEAGQASRVLTGYDVLLPSVLVEAQLGEIPTVAAAPCPLRGFRSAQVIPSSAPGMQLAAATAMLGGAAGLDDKIADRDLPSLLRPFGRRVAGRLWEAAVRASERSGLDAGVFRSALGRSQTAEQSPQCRLEDALAAAGELVGEAFARAAIVAGRPANELPLRQAGEAFGRLIHLLDAVADRADDRRHGRYNPLEATATSDVDASALARRLHRRILDSLQAASFEDRALLDALFGPTVAAAIGRGTAAPAPVDLEARRSERSGGLGTAVAIGVAAVALAQPASWGGGPYGPYGDPYRRPPRYRRGPGCRPSCGELLACDCLANCCCGDDCCCCVI